MKDRLLQQIADLEDRVRAASGDELNDILSRLEALRRKLAERMDSPDEGDQDDLDFDNLPV